MRIGNAELSEMLQAELGRWGVPGAVAGVVAPGGTAVAAAGVTSLDGGDAVHEETPFRVASITKPLTATLAALLADEGLLDLDAPVQRVVPALSAGQAAVCTPRQLLAHLSGLECELPHGVERHGQADGALAAAAAEVGRIGALTAPGELWAYCNAGYWLAGHAVAVAAGVTFEQVAHDLVLTPLEMSGSGFAHDGVPPPGAAVGHAPAGPGSLEHVVVPGYRFARARVPSGGLVATVPDLLRLAVLHLEHGTLADLQRPVAAAVGVSWGTGWAVEQVAGVTMVAHGGSYGGFQSQLTLVPERGVAVAVLTNSGRGSAVTRAVVEQVLAVECGVERPAPQPLAGEQVTGRAGVYRAQGLTVEVRETSGTRPETSASDERGAAGAQPVEAHGAARLSVQVQQQLPGGGVASPPPLHGVAVAPGRFMVLEGEARGAQFDFPGPGRVRVGGRLAVRAGAP